MSKNKLLSVSLVAIMAIAIFHYFAINNGWYWTFRWLDIPVHIVGGFWVSIMALWIALSIGHIKKITNYKKRAFFIMLGSALVMAILWEIFETTFKITFLHNIGYWRGSLKDIASGLAGGFVAYLYFTKNKKTYCSIFDETIKNDFIINL